MVKATTTIQTPSTPKSPMRHQGLSEEAAAGDGDEAAESGTGRAPMSCADCAGESATSSRRRLVSSIIIHSLNEPENVAVVIRPQTRRNLHCRRMRSVLQSLDIKCARVPRQQYPATGRKGIVGGVDIGYSIGVEVRDHSLQHWKQVDVAAADVDGDDSMIRIQMLPVSFKCLPGEQMDGNCIARESIKNEDIELL